MKMSKEEDCPICYGRASMISEWFLGEFHRVCRKCGFRKASGYGNLVSRLRKPSEID